MILLHKKRDVRFEIIEDDINFLTIEEKKLFEQILFELGSSIKHGMEFVCIFDNDKEIDMKKTCELIVSPLDLVYDKKTYQKVLFDLLHKDLELYDLNYEIADAFARIIDCLNKLSLNCEYEIEFKDDELDTMKIFDIQLKEPSGTFVEKIVDYISNVRKLLRKKVIFIYNCSAYIKDDDYKHIRKLAKYEKITVVFINNAQILLKDNVNKYIIDTDMCEIHEEYI